MNASQAHPGRCLITGASGFIGTRLCEFFVERGFDNFAPMVRSAQSAATLRSRWPQLVEGNLLNTKDVRQALRGCDAVVHLAHGVQGPQATRQLVEAAIESGVRRFVHISTMSVHGPAPGPEAAREETAHIGRYTHDYSDSKAEQEEIVRDAHQQGGLEVVILRPTIVYGPHSHFVSQIVKQARDGSVTMFDHGSGICNALYVDDLCRAIEAALVSTDAVGEAMFINGDEAISWREFIEAFASMAAPAPRFVNLSSAEALAYWQAHPPVEAKGLLDRIVLKLKRMACGPGQAAPYPPLGRVQREVFPVFFINDKAKRLLRWSPAVNFCDGVALTRAWLGAKEVVA